VLAAVVALLATACWTPSFTPGTYTVAVTSNVVYGQGEINGGGTFTNLQLDLYTPQGTGQSELPLVVVVHGGGFVGGSKTQSNVVSWSRAFAARGFLVASIDYRLAGANPVPSARVQPSTTQVTAAPRRRPLRRSRRWTTPLTALDFLIARPDTADAMTTLVGGSGGDHRRLRGVRAPTTGHPATADQRRRVELGRLPVRVGCAVHPARTLDPDTLYSEPPIFMAHATGDPTVAYSLSTDIAARATTVGLDHRLYTKNAAVHGFDLAAEVYAPGVSVLDAQISFVICSLYPHLEGTADCA
jgi:acetyl esterase/lipase